MLGFLKVDNYLFGKNKNRHQIYFPQTFNNKKVERKCKKKETNQNVKPATVQPTSKNIILVSR